MSKQMFDCISMGPAWLCIPAIPATQEPEAGGLEFRSQPWQFMGNSYKQNANRRVVDVNQLIEILCSNQEALGLILNITGRKKKRKD
jgi:hypothetical protein